MGMLVLMCTLSLEASAEQWFKDEEKAIYANMKRYGVNRENVAAMQQLSEKVPPYSEPHVSILAKDLYKPGEYYRFEMDEYVVNMIVPDVPVSLYSIWPYTNTRTPSDGMKKYLKQGAVNNVLSIAQLTWKSCATFSCVTSSISITYQILNSQRQENYATPGTALKILEERQKKEILSLAELADMEQRNVLNPRMGNQIALKPETVVINGRIWIRSAMQQRKEGTPAIRYSTSLPPTYLYVTRLGQDRLLVISVGTSDNEHDLTNPSTWSSAVRKGYALIDQVISSIRVTQLNDDGSPDPFVVERVEPAPLPVREPLPQPASGALKSP
jgi:hypothetical protein